MPPATTSLPNPAIRDGKPVLTIKMNVIWNQEAAQFQEQRRSPPVPRRPLQLLPLAALVPRSADIHSDVRTCTATPSTCTSCLLPQEKPSLPPCIFLLSHADLCLSDQTPSTFSGTAVQSQDPWGQSFYILEQQCALLGLVQGKRASIFYLAWRGVNRATSLEDKVAVCSQPFMTCVSIGPASPPSVMSFKEKSELMHKCMCMDPKMKHYFYSNALDIQ